MISEYLNITKEITDKDLKHLLNVFNLTCRYISAPYLNFLAPYFQFQSRFDQHSRSVCLLVILNSAQSILLSVLIVQNCSTA